MTTQYLDNFYARLGIPRSANFDEIQRAYRRAARQFHPDTNQGKTGANELFLLVQQAFDTLSDPTKRSAYDASLPEDIDGPPTLMVNALFSRAQVTPGEPDQVVYVLLDLMPSVSEDERHSAPPLNVALVLDNSTSMAGNRMGQVLKAASQFMQQLTAHDILSVVAFNDRAHVIVPAQRGTETGRLVSQISKLQTGGGTEIYQGLSAGLKEVQRNLRPTSINHIVLITDGKTYGDEAECLQLAEQAAAQGVPISAIGIGEEWNEDFIDKLVSKAGGSSLYAADKSTEIHKLLEQKLTKLNQIYANNVKLNYDNGTLAKLNYVFRLAPDLGPIAIEQPVFLGNIPLESSLSVLLEFEVDCRRARDGELVLAEGSLSLDVPSRTIPSNTARFRLVRPILENLKPEAPPAALINAIGKLSLYRMQERAREDAERGDGKGAAKRMRMLATQLLTQGERSLARTVLLAAEDLNEGEAMGDKAGKQIKYGTRALMDITAGRSRYRGKP